MSKSLAELRQSPRVGLPERTYALCLAPKLIGEVQGLLSELEDAMVSEAAQREGDESGAPPKRMAAKPASAKIQARLADLRGEMAEHTGTLILRGVTEGEWRLWVDAHPAREGNTRDAAIAYDCCNADALVDSLGQFAYAWNDEPLKPGDWEFLRDNAAPGDIKTLAQIVVAMHESVVNVPKLLSSSLGIHDGATG